MNLDIKKAAESIEKMAGIHPITDNGKGAKSPPYQIFWNGVAIKLRSGKSVWPSLGAAKVALTGKIDTRALVEKTCTDIPTHEISQIVPANIYRGETIYYKREFEKSIYHEIIHKLQEAKILEFRPLI